MDILDIIHVSGYVWKAAKVFHSHKEQQEAFVQERLLRILRGEVSGVVTGLRRMASQHGLKGAALKDVTTTCNYFENNARPHALRRVLEGRLSDRERGHRGGLPTRHQRSHGARRHALDAGGCSGDARRPLRVRLQRMGEFQQLPTSGTSRTRASIPGRFSKLPGIQGLKACGATVTPRLYRTGDLGRFTPDGEVEFGRVKRCSCLRDTRTHCGPPVRSSAREPRTAAGYSLAV